MSKFTSGGLIGHVSLFTPSIMHEKTGFTAPYGISNFLRNSLVLIANGGVNLFNYTALSVPPQLIALLQVFF